MLDLSRCLFMDFEARSELDITKCGARAYAEHPTTEPLCCAWVIGLTNEIQVWVQGDTIPAEWTHRNDVTWVAQNKDTERHLLDCKFDIHVVRSAWVDLATWASAAGMPRNLHDIAESLHLQVQKENKGAMLALAKPRKITRKNKSKWWTREERPDLYAQLYDYCTADVNVMRVACSMLPPYDMVLPPQEQALGVLNDRMNDRGVPIDHASVALALAVVETHAAELRAIFEAIYPGVNPKHPPSVSKALGTDNARKETIRDDLKLAMTPERRRAMTALKTIKTASTAKLAAMLRHLCMDGKVHGAMVFHGAGRTGRWSSMGVQVHNLMRGLAVTTPDWPAVDASEGAMDKFFEALALGLVDLIYPNPTRAVAAAMRGFIWWPQ